MAEQNTSPETENQLAAVIMDGQSADSVLASLKLTLAIQVAPTRWHASLERCAAGIEGGATLDEAIQAELPSMPRELRCLAAESLKVPDPANFLVEAIKARQDVRVSWHRLAMLCFYPLCLFLFALVVGVAFSYTMRYMIDVKWIEEFGLVGMESTLDTIEDQHHAFVGLAMVTGAFSSFAFWLLETFPALGALG